MGRDDYLSSQNPAHSIKEKLEKLLDEVKEMNLTPPNQDVPAEELHQQYEAKEKIMKNAYECNRTAHRTLESINKKWLECNEKLQGRKEDKKQLPLSLLRTAQNHPMLVELKNGETYNGHLVACDAWMNIHLRDAICTSRDGDRFLKMQEVYVRGSTIKYLRIPDDVVELVKEEVKEVRRQQKDQQRAKRNLQGRGGGQQGRGGASTRGAGRGQHGWNRDKSAM
ncbi:LSM domain protein [Onchocerca flexuosa]|uniref:U6 snRNA-associated Sm-like protein LSm4 n=1 Tax=Onchocerca flexuosa TaxID=387005 RepID=A0A238BP60_9BILA|nr:LSM domain protein [Onchocerca flexuosa]